MRVFTIKDINILVWIFMNLHLNLLPIAQKMPLLKLGRHIGTDKWMRVYMRLGQHLTTRFFI